MASFRVRTSDESYFTTPDVSRFISQTNRYVAGYTLKKASRVARALVSQLTKLRMEPCDAQPLARYLRKFTKTYPKLWGVFIGELAVESHKRPILREISEYVSRTDEELRPFTPEIWEEYVARMEEHSPKGLRLLRISAHFHHKPIPLAWLGAELDLLVNDDRPAPLKLSSKNLSKDKASELVVQLGRYELVEHSYKPRRCFLLPEVSEVIRSEQEYQTAVNVLLTVVKDLNTDDTADWRELKLWRYHAQAVIGSEFFEDVDPQQKYELYLNLGEILGKVMIDYNSAIEFLTRAESFEYAPVDHPDWHVRFHLAMGNCLFTLMHYRRASESFCSALGVDNPESLEVSELRVPTSPSLKQLFCLSLSGLADVLNKLNKCEQAYRLALRAFETDMGGQSTDKAYIAACIKIVNTLASSVLPSNNSRHLSECPVNIKTLNNFLDEPNHPYLIDTCTLLGRAHQSVGLYKEAINEYLRALSIFEELYPNDSESTGSHIAADIYKRLGSVHMELNSWDDALMCYQNAVNQFIHLAWNQKSYSSPQPSVGYPRCLFNFRRDFYRGITTEEEVFVGHRAEVARSLVESLEPIDVRQDDSNLLGNVDSCGLNSTLLVPEIDLEDLFQRSVDRIYKSPGARSDEDNQFNSVPINLLHRQGWIYLLRGKYSQALQALRIATQTALDSLGNKHALSKLLMEDWYLAHLGEKLDLLNPVKQDRCAIS